jgi:spore coat protein U-like protein
VGSGATTTTRKMTLSGGSATLSYQMFQNSTHTTNWGNTAGTDTVSINSTSSVVTTEYALLPAGQFPAPGTYTDTITITITLTAKNGAISTGTFTVTATVVAYCQLSASALAFGTYSGTVIDSDSSVSVSCTNTTPYNVGLNAGTATGATVAARKMTGPSSTLLSYTLYKNSGLSTNWGNTVGTDTESGTGSGTVQALTVYGQIPAGQYVRPGSYTDTITATITY